MFFLPFVLSTFLYVIRAEKILCVFPIPSASHHAVHLSICKELSLRGHQVTVVSSHSLNDNSLINMTEIQVQGLQQIAERNQDKTEKMSKNNFMLTTLLFAAKYYSELIEETFTNLNMVLDPKAKFDLVIVENLNPLIYALKCRFNVPFVGVSSSFIPLYFHDVLGNPAHPALHFEYKMMSNSEMYAKIHGFLFSSVMKMFLKWHVFPKLDKLSKKHFGETCPYLEDLYTSANLVISHTNPFVHIVRPNVPTMVETGGLIHIRPKKPLPQDLQTILDQNRQGVVYFSLGSNIKFSALNPKLVNIIIPALSELPYKVLLKWENDSIFLPSDNMVVRKWFPQQDVLGHENIKVFVSQGGLQSVEESIVNAVPLVGIPFFLDQPSNIMQLQKLGAAEYVDYATMNKEILKNAIMKVVRDNKYRKKMLEIRNIIQDRDMESLENSIWWIEYVLRHKGAAHLKSDATLISFGEYFLCDVLCTLGIAAASAFLVSRCLKKYVKSKIN